MKHKGRTVTALIDVRSWLEFLLGHAPGAIRIPLWKVGAAELERRGIARDAYIVVYCASGSRSAFAARALTQAGFTRVVDGGGLAEVRRNLSAE